MGVVTYTQSTACSIGGCRVMVRKHATLTPRLMTALALADHVRTLHVWSWRLSRCVTHRTSQRNSPRASPTS